MTDFSFFYVFTFGSIAFSLFPPCKTVALEFKVDIGFAFAYIIPCVCVCVCVCVRVCVCTVIMTAHVQPLPHQPTRPACLPLQNDTRPEDEV